MFIEYFKFSFIFSLAWISNNFLIHQADVGVSKAMALD